DSLLERAELAMNARLYARALRRARRVITISSFSESRLCLAFPDAAGKTTVIPPGVTSRFFRNGLAPKERNFILTVTRLDESDRIKNVHGVIEALGELKDYNFQYRIVAGAVTGGYRQELERLIVDRGLSDRVWIEGRKSDEELADYYARASLFVLA